MHTETVHITSYRANAWVLIALLSLTLVTITVTWIDLSALTVGIALVIATTKAYIVLTYFMHLKFERLTLGLIALTPLFLCIFLILMII